MENKPYKAGVLQPIGGGFPNVADLFFVIFLLFVLSKPVFWNTHKTLIGKCSVISSLYGFKIILFSTLGYASLVVVMGLLIIIKEVIKNFYEREKTLKLYVIDGKKAKYEEPDNNEKPGNYVERKDVAAFESNRTKIFEFVLEEKKRNGISNNYGFSERLVFRFFGSGFWEYKTLEQFLKDNFESFKYFITLTDPLLLVLSFREAFYFALMGLPITSGCTWSHSCFCFLLVDFEILIFLYLLFKVILIENKIRSLFYFFDYIYFIISTRGFNTFFDDEVLNFLNEYGEKIKSGKFLFYEIVKIVFKL